MLLEAALDPFDKVVLAKLPGADVHAQAEIQRVHLAFFNQLLEGRARLIEYPGANFEQLIKEGKVDPLNFSLCVNISPRQFRQDDFVERVERSLKQHSLPYSLLKLEITEGIVIP